MKKAVLVFSALLSGCAGSTPPLVERPRLPPAPVNFGKPVQPPALALGESVRVFAIKNRAALHQANKRLENDAAFWRDTEEAFSREPEPEPGFFERLF